MVATEWLCRHVGINPNKLSKEEVSYIEAEIFIRVCDELKEVFKNQNKAYFTLMKFSSEMENIMLEANFIRCVINDILLTEEYSLEGIAFYTESSEEVIYDITIGKNSNPSLTLSRKIIELHRLVKPNLYREIIQKIINTYLQPNKQTIGGWG